MSEVLTNENPPTQPTKKFDLHKVFAAIGIILIVLIIVGGSIWFFVQRADDKAKNAIDQNSSVTTTASAQPKTATSSSLLSNSKCENNTFTSQTRESSDAFDPQLMVKYSFECPSDFRVVVGEGSFITNDPSLVSYESVSTPGKLSAQAFITYSEPENISDGKETLLGGKKAYRLNIEGGLMYYLPSVTTKEGIEVKFGFTCGFVNEQKDLAEKTCDEIASTFKFL